VNPLVSVIVPAYNAEKFISVAVSSVVAQTYSALEVIVIDDGSSDSTKDIVNEIAANDSRVKCYSIKNSGRAAARNYGISKATGSWFAFLDADDFWAPEKLSKQLACWQINEKVGLIYTERTWVDAKGTPLLDQPQRYNLPEGMILDKLVDGNYICTSTVLIKKELVDTVGGFDESKDFKNCQDYDLWIRVAPKTIAAAVSDPLCFYRLHDDNAHKNVLSRYIGLRSCMKRLQQVLVENRMFDAGAQKRLELRTAQICNQFAVGLFKIKAFEHAAQALKTVDATTGLSTKRKVLLWISQFLSVVGIGRI
jgi:glycosyltransferase involved in cell wall biosynthesis